MRLPWLPRIGCAFGGLNGFNIPATLVLALADVAFISSTHAQTNAVITNLAQLTKAISHNDQLISGIRLNATVFACNTNTGTLALQDPTGACLLELEGLKDDFQPGETVEIEATSCLLNLGEVGIYMAAAPSLNNDGVHEPRNVSYECSLEAGRHPLRLDWFNQLRGSELAVRSVAVHLDEQLPAEAQTETNFIHAIRAECFHGFWSRLPDFQILQSVKTGPITNFDLGFRTRDEMVGIRFEGYFDAPRAGKYFFDLYSDDGSRLWVGSPEVPVRRIGTSVPPPAPLASIGERTGSPTELRLATIEGRVNFVSRLGKGLRFEMRSEQGSVSVAMADAGTLEPADLLNACVRVSGVAGSVLRDGKSPALGSLAVVSSKQLTIVENPPGTGALPAVLTSVTQVHTLSSDDAANRLPVTIRGAVTAVALLCDRWMAIQDYTRGSFVSLHFVSNCVPQVGELWSVTGYTEPGDFAPVIVAERATLLGKTQLPEPTHPTWNQLANGSMDVQRAELQGFVTGVHSNGLSLLMPEGRLEVVIPNWGEAELKSFDRTVVCIRGTLFAQWNAETHEVHAGNITMYNASIMMVGRASSDPFDVPEKVLGELFRFDAKTTPFQRVKVRGQVTYVDPRRVFLEQGAGILIHPSTNVNLKAGDLVEAVGYPMISGASPQLWEALLRKTGAGVLPKVTPETDSELSDGKLFSRRICIEGNLAGLHTEEDTLVLQMQTRTRLFLARVANTRALHSLRLGSKLSLTGIYVSDARNDADPNDGLRFDVLLNSPGDVIVLSKPSWWTLRRLLSAVGLLLVTLALAIVWIALLRRKVVQRTMQLQHEIRERERAERQHALEAERSRIARDLHDDLGSRLTEINFLADTCQKPGSGNDTHIKIEAISDKAKALVRALDVIVWAVDPRDNSPQSLADYLSGYAREYLCNSSVVCRFKIPVTFPEATIDGQTRHEVLMVVKETLNNVVRHAAATEVQFQMAVASGTLEICIADNGKGFDPNIESDGHGLTNCSARLEKIGGSCRIESCAGAGTTVRI